MRAAAESAPPPLLPASMDRWRHFALPLALPAAMRSDGQLVLPYFPPSPPTSAPAEEVSKHDERET